jgi:hypothetical protein
MFVFKLDHVYVWPVIGTSAASYNCAVNGVVLPTPLIVIPGGVMPTLAGTCTVITVLLDAPPAAVAVMVAEP